MVSPPPPPLVGSRCAASLRKQPLVAWCELETAWLEMLVTAVRPQAAPLILASVAWGRHGGPRRGQGSLGVQVTTALASTALASLCNLCCKRRRVQTRREEEGEGPLGDGRGDGGPQREGEGQRKRGEEGGGGTDRNLSSSVLWLEMLVTAVKLGVQVTTALASLRFANESRRWS